MLAITCRGYRFLYSFAMVLSGRSFYGGLILPAAILLPENGNASGRGDRNCVRERARLNISGVRDTQRKIVVVSGRIAPRLAKRLFTFAR